MTTHEPDLDMSRTMSEVGLVEESIVTRIGTLMLAMDPAKAPLEYDDRSLKLQSGSHGVSLHYSVSRRFGGSLCTIVDYSRDPYGGSISGLNLSAKQELLRPMEFHGVNSHITTSYELHRKPQFNSLGLLGLWNTVASAARFQRRHTS